jgi:hypothetical protein
MSLPAIPPDLEQRLREELDEAAGEERRAPAKHRLRRVLPRPVRRVVRGALVRSTALLWPLLERNVNRAVATSLQRALPRRELEAWRSSIEARVALAETHLDALDRTLAEMGQAIPPAAGVAGERSGAEPADHGDRPPGSVA